MMTNAQTMALATAGTIATHNATKGWEVDGERMALHLILADLIVWARCSGFPLEDIHKEWLSAHEVVAEVYDDEDLMPSPDDESAIMNAALEA